AAPNHQANIWQTKLTVQHDLRTGMSESVGYDRTWYGGFLATDNRAYTPADFDQYCITGPTDTRLSTSGQQICGLYDVKPALFGQVNNLVTQASNYGKQTEVFNGVDVNFNARFGKGGQFQGGVATGQLVADNCYTMGNPQLTFAAPVLPVSGTTAPRTAAFCHISQPWSASTQVKFSMIYPL